MDYHCPACEKDLGSRRLSQAVIARMEIECTFCKSKLQFNVHRLEFAVVLFNFAAIALFIADAYWLHNKELAISAFAVAMLGALSLPVLERTWLRTWPRFSKAVPKAMDFES